MKRIAVFVLAGSIVFTQATWSAEYNKDEENIINMGYLTRALEVYGPEYRPYLEKSAHPSGEETNKRLQQFYPELTTEWARKGAEHFDAGVKDRGLQRACEEAEGAAEHIADVANATAVWDCTITKSGVPIRLIVVGNKLKENGDTLGMPIAFNNETALIAAFRDTGGGLEPVTFITVIDKRNGNLTTDMVPGTTPSATDASDLWAFAVKSGANGNCIKD